MEELTKQDIEFLEKFDEDEIDAIIEYEEPFEKSGSYTCVRCSNKVSTKGGRCASCLAKLRRAKKTPGHWQRAQTKADDALRRQRGANGTAPGTSKGNGTRKQIVNKVQRAEKKTGQKLSPDRKNNSKGYSPKNTRAVPERLNVGRHDVDSKKLSAWKSKMKKHNLSVDALLTLIKYKDEELYKSLDIDSFHKLFA